MTVSTGESRGIQPQASVLTRYPTSEPPVGLSALDLHGGPQRVEEVTHSPRPGRRTVTPSRRATSYRLSVDAVTGSSTEHLGRDGRRRSGLFQLVPRREVGRVFVRHLPLGTALDGGPSTDLSRPPGETENSHPRGNGDGAPRRFGAGLNHSEAQTGATNRALHPNRGYSPSTVSRRRSLAPRTADCVAPTVRCRRRYPPATWYVSSHATSVVVVSQTGNVTASR